MIQKIKFSHLICFIFLMQVSLAETNTIVADFSKQSKDRASKLVKLLKAEDPSFADLLAEQKKQTHLLYNKILDQEKEVWSEYSGLFFLQLQIYIGDLKIREALSLDNFSEYNRRRSLTQSMPEVYPTNFFYKPISEKEVKLLKEFLAMEPMIRYEKISEFMEPFSDIRERGKFRKDALRTIQSSSNRFKGILKMALDIYRANPRIDEKNRKDSLKKLAEYQEFFAKIYQKSFAERLGGVNLYFIKPPPENVLVSQKFSAYLLNAVNEKDYESLFFTYPYHRLKEVIDEFPHLSKYEYDKRYQKYKDSYRSIFEYASTAKDWRQGVWGNQYLLLPDELAYKEDRRTYNLLIYYNHPEGLRYRLDEASRVSSWVELSKNKK